MQRAEQHPAAAFCATNPLQQSEITGAALFKLQPAGARAGVIAPEFQLDSWVNEIPVAAITYECRAFAVAVRAALITPVRGKNDVGVLRLALDQLRLLDFKPEPGAAQAPGADRLVVEARLLGR